MKGLPAWLAFSLSCTLLISCNDIDLRNTLADTVVKATLKAPSNLNAIPTSISAINLTWTDNSSNETGFKVERRQDGLTEWKQFPPTLADVTSWDDTGLNQGITYHYRVYAYDDVGDSYPSNTAEATTFAPDINVKQGSTNIPSGGSFDFGSVVLGSSSSAISFTIENLGTVNLTLDGSPKVNLSGTNASMFSIGTQPSSPVTAGSSTSFTLVFSPSGTVGSKSATVSIANNYSNENPYTFTVIGTATSPGITVSPTSGLVTTEAGGTASFTIVLNTQPTANVTIGLSSSDTTEGTVSPTSLTFTSSNWNTPQTVTVTGVNDSVADGNQPYTIITAAATSTDSNL